MRVTAGKLLPIKEVIRDLQQRSDAPSRDETIDGLRAISGNDPCRKETQLEVEAELAVAMRSAA